MRMARRMGLRSGRKGYQLSYTGTYTDEIITSQGKCCRLLTLTGSGLLTVEGDVMARLCLVGGGSPGGTRYDGYGGAGGHVRHFDNALLTGGTILIGAAEGTTSFGSMVADGASGKDGGTGGGTRYGMGYGYGDGTPTTPFSDPVNFKRCGGAGGAGSVFTSRDQTKDSGWGHGGTNGGNGSRGLYGQTTDGGVGGQYGGGDGGTANNRDGKDATFYGAGGGGSALVYGDTHLGGTPGAGYQGVLYILIDAEEYPAA